MDRLVYKAYKIADKHNVILKGNIKISGDVNCILFAHYCKDTLFYKDFLNVAKDTIKVAMVSNKNLREIKRIIKEAGYKKVWTKGVFSVYGDLRSLAVAAEFGKWGDNGLVVNEEYGSNFIITGVFYK